MKTFEKLEQWGDRYKSPWIDFIRMILGAILLVKGFMFIMDTASLVQLLNDLNFGWDNVLMAHVIAIMHLFTGFLIIIGLATRVSCLVMIPIVAGAIFFANLSAGTTGELVLSIIVLLMLIFFFFKGSGRFSAYYYLINSRRSRLTDESRGDYKGGSPLAPMDKDANIL